MFRITFKKVIKMKIMEQTDCILCDPYECTCHFFSTNLIISQEGNSPQRVLFQGNPLNPMTFFQESPPPPFYSLKAQNKRSPGFQSDPNFNQGFPQHRNYFPNARVGPAKDFTTPQVNFWFI